MTAPEASRDNSQPPGGVSFGDAATITGVVVGGSVQGGINIYIEARRADSLVNMLKQSATAGVETNERPPCPYPGMVPFRPEDARFFYGREREIDKIALRLRRQDFLMVIGPSGSGKSSLVFAGLLPSMAKSENWEQGFWHVVTMRPGGHPMANLADALDGVEDGDLAKLAPAIDALLARHAPAQRLLVIVDQFEEVFTQPDQDEQGRSISNAGRKNQAEFFAALKALRPLDKCAVVLTMRADFYSDLMTSELWPLSEGERVEIAPMLGDELRDAIQLPAASLGVELEGELMERLISDAGDQPGILPLLQETLVLLWGRMEGRALTLDAYERLGQDGQSGLSVALAIKADETFASLTIAQQVLARRIFLRLTQFGEGCPDTRRQQIVSSLRSPDDDAALFDTTLAVLTDNRLLTTTGDDKGEARRVDLAHEALIREWPTLRDWLTERREAEQTRRRLEEKATEWVRLGRGTGGLLDEIELAEAEQRFVRLEALDLGNPSEELEKLLQASRKAIDDRRDKEEADRQGELNQARELAAVEHQRAEVARSARRRLLVIVGLLVALLGLAVAALAWPQVLRLRAQGELVRIPAGNAKLGKPDTPLAYEKLRDTQLPAFAIEKYEVSNQQYKLCMDADVCTSPVMAEGAKALDNPDITNHPVRGVSAVQAALYCKWLDRRLPTADEWERAARGPEGLEWPWGDNQPSPERANLLTETYTPKGTLRVDSNQDGVTPEGVFNMVGNVAEWTSSIYPSASASAEGQSGTWDGKVESIDANKWSYLFIRGGAWNAYVGYIAQAGALEPAVSEDSLGFRCAVNVSEP
jgi:formylglycine-generating enzyme required for sulfatase activity